MSQSMSFDLINNPSHYCEGRKIQPLDVIEDWDLDFACAQVVKYIGRAGRKGSALQDCEKALFYLSRKVDRMKRANG